MSEVKKGGKRMKTAVIVVDMLNDFIKEDGALPCGVNQEFTDTMVKFLKTVSKMEMPIIFVCDSHDGNDKEFEMFPKHCVKGTEGAEIIDELKPFIDKNLVVPKTRYSGFYGTELEDILKGLEVTTLMIVGVCTDICVMHTCADARNRDYEVFVIKNLVASFDEEAHKFALGHMENILGATIIDEEL
jgi:nicotinamidase-related amidase